VCEKLVEFGDFFFRCKVHNYWTIATFDADAKLWKGVLEGITEGVPWVAPTIETIPRNFCACVHNYFETCTALRRVPEKPESCDSFMPDAPFVCEVDGSGTRITIDDPTAEVIVSIRNSITGDVLEEYYTKELLIEHVEEVDCPSEIKQLRFVEANNA